MTEREPSAEEIKRRLAELSQYNKRLDALDDHWDSQDSPDEQIPRLAAAYEQIPTPEGMASGVIDKLHLLASHQKRDDVPFPIYYFHFQDSLQLRAFGLLQARLRTEPGCTAISANKETDAWQDRNRPIYQLGDVILTQTLYRYENTDKSEISDIPDGQIYQVAYGFHYASDPNDPSGNA